MSAAFALLDALDADPTPRFTIEPPDKSDALELTRQLAFRQAMRLQAPGVLVYANMNAGKRGRGAVAQARREGMTAGVPDLTVVWNHGCAWLEFKAGKTKPSLAQIEMGNRLVSLGQRFAVVRSVPFALALLRDWGAPVR